MNMGSGSETVPGLGGIRDRAGEKGPCWQQGSCSPGRGDIWVGAAGSGPAVLCFPFCSHCSGYVVIEVMTLPVVWLWESGDLLGNPEALAAAGCAGP